MYDTNLDNKIDYKIKLVDAPNITLYEIIENIRKEYPLIDPEPVHFEEFEKSRQERRSSRPKRIRRVK